MSQSAGKWLMAAGAVVMFFGLCVLPAALGDAHDPSMLAVAGCLFSLGSLTVAGGIYMSARALQAAGSNGTGRDAAPAAPRRQKGACDACQVEMPVIQCTVHRVHLCGSCLGQHYDFRSCAYVPTTRRGAPRGTKSVAVRAGRA